MKIRFAIPEDVPGILELLRQVGRVHYEGRPDLFRSDAQKYGPSQVLSMLGREDTPILVAVDRKKVRGYCMLQLQTHYRDTVIADHTTCYIDDLCVDKRHRGKHIGAELYAAARDYAREKSCKDITLNVWTLNDGAMKFYVKLGLKPRKITMEEALEEN